MAPYAIYMARRLSRLNGPRLRREILGSTVFFFLVWVVASVWPGMRCVAVLCFGLLDFRGLGDRKKSLETQLGPLNQELSAW